MNKDTWTQTVTGRKFYPFAPRVEDVDIIDIAHSLSMTCRYNGHTSRFYSVAEHSVLMSYQVSKEAAFYALMHDAPEAYFGDIVRPIKQNMPEVYKIEAELLRVIKERFSIKSNCRTEHEIKVADDRMIATEKLQLMPSGHGWGMGDIKPYDIEIEGWEWGRAKNQFMARFLELGANDL